MNEHFTFPANWWDLVEEYLRREGLDYDLREEAGRVTLWPDGDSESLDALMEYLEQLEELDIAGQLGWL